jgi:hypothetical protein
VTPLTDFRAWLNPRNARFWLVILLVVYTLAGFFLLPWVIKRELPGFAQSLVQRPASVAAVRFNPWTLVLQADQLELRDKDDSPLISFAGLRVNLQVKSLFRRALVFREVTLSSPTINLVRDGFTDTNLGRLAADVSGPEDAEADAKEDGELLRLVIESLVIDNGAVKIKDRMPATPFDTELAPINISINGLSTLPNQVGDKTIRIATEDDGLIEWDGTLQISPLRSAGSIRLSIPGLPLAKRYLDDVLDFDLDGGRQDLSFDYDMQGLRDGLFKLAVDNLNLNITETELATEDKAEPFLSFGNLRVSGGRVRLPENTASVEEIVISKPRVDAWLREDGALNLATLLTRSADAMDGGSSEEATETGETPATTDVSTTDSGDAESKPPDSTSADANPASGPAAAAAETPETAEKQVAEAQSAEPAVAESTSSVPDDAAADANPFTVTLGRLKVEGFAASFADRTLPEPGRLGVEDLNLEVRDISNAPDTRFPTELDLAFASGGRLKASGELGVLPDVVADLAVKVNDLEMKVGQPWLNPLTRATIQSGQINAEATLKSSPEETLDVRGLVTINDFDLADNNGTEVLSWQRINLEELIFQLDANQLEIARFNLIEPYARVRIDEERNVNLAQLVIEPEPGTPANTSTRGEPLVFRLGTSKIANGRLDFADLSLPLPFDTTVTEFGGSISTLASDTREPSNLDFAGRVGEFGEAKITGQLVALDPLAESEIRLRFRNVNMPDLSPYTVDFAGRKIAKGKLNLDLDYSFDSGQLVGKNNIVIEKIKLGEKVDNPDAVDLPLGLAIALLSDTNGVINVSLDIEGDVNDPEFSAGGVIGKALVNLLTKIVTSPFRLLGNLAGMGGDDDVDLQTLNFEAGKSKLSPPTEEKLTQLGAALAQRPALQLSVHGAYATESDRFSIADARVTAEARARADTAEDSDDLLAEKARDVFEDMLRERRPDVNLKELRAGFAVVDDDPDTPEFDTIAYLTELKKLLIEVEPVSAQDLQALGSARAAAVTEYLATSVGLPADRVQVTATIEVEPGEEGVVSIKLELDAG